MIRHGCYKIVDDDADEPVYVIAQSMDEACAWYYQFCTEIRSIEYIGKGTFTSEAVEQQQTLSCYKVVGIDDTAPLFIVASLMDEACKWYYQLCDQRRSNSRGDIMCYIRPFEEIRFAEYVGDGAFVPDPNQIDRQLAITPCLSDKDSDHDAQR